jgi:hypothetical protein
MSLVVLSRESMRGLKAQTDEENRLKMVNTFVTQTYNRVVKIAKMTEATSYQSPLSSVFPASRLAIRALRTQEYVAFYLRNSRTAAVAAAAAPRAAAAAAAAEAAAAANKISVCEIIKRLQKLFPDCLVKHRMVVRGPDGKMHDAAFAAQLHEDWTSNPVEDCIVIDWS